jgi:ABC-type bacteriocin/lantibiotic exporter with double-glycine peptidase domain
MRLVFIFGAALTIVAFFGSGLAGPSWLKAILRRFHRWDFRDTAIFAPIDPYKPLKSEIKQSLKNFWPTAKRLSAAKSQVLLVILLLSIIGLVIFFFVLIDQ